ncbi:MAG: hypothetical protein IT379_05655 [Deltaproteobacteria bacterium]|nr:hypothetical protein [Deltaproteobacteria bacterium]
MLRRSITPLAFVLATALGAAAACGGAQAGVSLPSSADLPVSEGCDVARGCPCVDSPAELGTPSDGRRRFQVRMGGARNTRIGVRIGGVGTAVRPDGDPGERCFRVDLEPGRVYDVELIAISTERNRPLSARWDVHELATSVLFPGGDPGVAGSAPAGRRPALYTTFSTGCGTLTGPCQLEGARAWLQELAASTGDWDPCGSTQVRSVRAEGADLPNDGRLADVLVGFQLVMRRDPPSRPPESEGCPRR